MVTLGRLELPTRSLGNCCSIHLSYRATFPEFTLALLVFGAAVMPLGTKTKTPPESGVFTNACSLLYNVDSISNPHASNNASGMYLEFRFRRAHSRSRVDRTY